MYYFFDLDGTLVDSNGVWIDVDTVFLARRGLPYTAEFAQGVAHSIFPLAAKFAREYCGIDDTEEEIMAEWMALAGDRYAKTVPLKPFVREFLLQCREKGIGMSLISSCVPEHGKAVLERHGLLGCFDHLVFAHDLGILKSDSRIFLEAARLCGVDPSDCVMFDDSIRSCQGAMEAGMQTVGVYDDLFRRDKADMRSLCGRYIRSFEELLDA